MKYKIDDRVWFYSDAEGNDDMKGISVDELKDKINKYWAGVITGVHIDKEKHIAYDIQTYMMYEPYISFEKMSEERLFGSEDELKTEYIKGKLEEISKKRKELDDLEDALKKML